MATIGARFGISPQAVHQRLARLGIPARQDASAHRGQTLATPEQVAAIIQRRAAEESVARIARAVGLSYSVVRGVLRFRGIDTRDRRHRNRPAVPRTCTICRRTEAEGARFAPGEPWNQCAACTAAWQRAYQRKHRA